MSFLSDYFKLFWLQHNDPISFIREVNQSQSGSWWVIGLLRAGMVVAILAGLGLVALLNGYPWINLITHAILAQMLIQALSGIAVIITHQAYFWLLYTYSPPVFLVTMLCGLSPLTPLGLVLGWGVGVPFLIGALLADACTVWVYNQTETAYREHRRQRQGGPMAELPALSLWTRARLVRITGAIGYSLIIWTLFWPDDSSVYGIVPLVAGLCGCLHLEATLLGWTGGSSLVRFEMRQGGWQATYVGRQPLFMPLKQIQRVIVSAPSPIAASMMLLALLEQGYLGPVVRQAVGKFSSEQIHCLNLYLSLQTGGAAVIRYLKPAHSALLQPVADYYAALATEAAKPLDLQLWRSVLQPSGSFGSSWEPDIINILAEVQAALLCHEARPDSLNRAIDNLRSLIQSLYNLRLPTPPTEQLLQILPLSWPVALLIHLENHQRYLLSP